MGSGAAHAVFLSYASEDAAAAERVCTALREAGIDVFFDKSELRGGDAWDQSIRAQIRDCALFLPMISRHTQERLEGYFRLEWKLAVDRSQAMAAERPYLVPVVIDDTHDRDAIVPDAFRAVQWTRLAQGATPPTFPSRVRQLLAQTAHADLTSSPPIPAAAPGGGRPTASHPRPLRRGLVLLGGVALVAVAATVALKLIDGPRNSRTTFSPPPHSIAVLPFANLSGDPGQEYFSDGLTEELLNSLTEIGELQVAARTSAFSFKGTNVDIGTIARKLNVGAILEGSVRRSGSTVRVTAQLIDPLTGFHLWSHSYDRELGDILKLETDVAGAVAIALKVSLLGNLAEKIELGGTHVPAAFDAYLRGRKSQLAAVNSKDEEQTLAAYTEAIELDPNYALAFANRSMAFDHYANELESPDGAHDSYERAGADARRALELAPDLAEGHLALAFYYEDALTDLPRSTAECERAYALAPGNAQVARSYGLFVAYLGRREAAIAAVRRAIALNPLDPNSHRSLAKTLYFSHQPRPAIAAYDEALALHPKNAESTAFRGLAYYSIEDFGRARDSCELNPDHWEDQQCLAVTYEKLGRHADAEAMVAKLTAAFGNTVAYQYATIYAQWGDAKQALDWLDTAWRLHDSGLGYLKTDPLMDPLRREPRFRAVLAAMKFPDP